jgi:hypothetical protein
VIFFFENYNFSFSYSIALNEAKILFEKKLFFVGFKQRPTEARLKPCKKSFFEKRL